MNIFMRTKDAVSDLYFWHRNWFIAIVLVLALALGVSAWLLWPKTGSEASSEAQCSAAIEKLPQYAGLAGSLTPMQEVVLKCSDLTQYPDQLSQALMPKRLIDSPRTRQDTCGSMMNQALTTSATISPLKDASREEAELLDRANEKMIDACNSKLSVNTLNKQILILAAKP